VRYLAQRELNWLLEGSNRGNGAGKFNVIQNTPPTCRKNSKEKKKKILGNTMKNYPGIQKKAKLKLIKNQKPLGDKKERKDPW
jgi:hypothetical protein